MALSIVKQISWYCNFNKDYVNKIKVRAFIVLGMPNNLS